MDLNKAAPVIEEVLKKVLEERKYPFGFGKYQGLGDKVASGKLRNSIQVQATGNYIEVMAEDYFKWVQSGRLPGKKGVPIEALEKWIKSRGLIGRDKKGRFIKTRSFAFAIQNNIKKFGIRPANFLDTAIETLAEDERIIDIIGEQAYEELIDLIQGI
jgi:hypothetical protein